MANAEYLEKLRDPRWQKKRLEIFERDGWACIECGDRESTLHVHHRYYLKDAEPWDYHHQALATLCESCHEKETAETAYAKQELLRAFAHMGADSSQLYDFAFTFEFSGVWMTRETWPVFVHHVGKLIDDLKDPVKRAALAENYETCRPQLPAELR